MSFGAMLLALHTLGAMLWVGGMYFVLAILRPSMAFLEGPLRLELHKRVLDRFFFAIWLVMPTMLVSGIILQYLFYGGIGASPWPLQMMTVTGLVMSAIFVAIALFPWRDFLQALKDEKLTEAGIAVHQIRRLLIVNLVLGALTTIVAMLDY